MVQEAPAQKQFIDVINPATLQKVGQVPIASPTQVHHAVAKARNAFLNWKTCSLHERVEYLYAARDWLIDHQNEVIDIICSETGKPRTEALLAEIFYCCDALTFYAKNAEKFLQNDHRSLHLLKNKRVYVSYQPLGVVGIISPWNYPFTLTFGEAIPALVSGNTVIIKPSEVTPLSGLLASRVFREVGLPDGVMQTLCGYGETGATLVDTCDMIAFTGSVETGKKVAMRAAQRLIPVLLELGGKDPMIVLSDADLERASGACVWGAFSNSGQLCISVERVYAEASIYDKFVEKVVAKTRQLRQGTECTYGQVDVGSMTMPEQIEIVEGHVQDAVKKGARILTGGKRNATFPGYFYEPTVLVNVDHSMAIMREETFGPVLPIVKVKNAEEALALANDSIYGLGASVWTQNKKQGVHLARQLEAGNVCVNDCIANYMAIEAPYGGMKESGLGRRHGEWGIRQFCQPQTVLIDRFGLRKEPFWYPYSEKIAKLVERSMRVLYRRGWKSKLFP